MVACPNCNSFHCFTLYKNKAMHYGISLIEKTIDIEVSLCEDCNFVFQSSAYFSEYDINIELLYKNYKISDMYNFPNRNYHHLKALAFLEDIIENKIEYNVLEIGSNRGDFLYLLKEKFPNINIIGCEPTEFKNLCVPTINRFFDKDLFNTKFDLIILRHTLEHIKYPKLFIDQLKHILKTDSVIFIEVPNLNFSLNNSIEDYTPDHVNYFTIDSLKSLLHEYKTLKYDDKEFLYTIFKLDAKYECKDKEVKYLSKTVDIKKLFNEFNNQISLLKHEIKRYDSIIFYGISNFYIWTYGKLKEEIKDLECYFMDDFLEIDHIYNLKRSSKIEKNSLVILCTSNLNIQENMISNLPSGTTIMKLWKGIELV